MSNEQQPKVENLELNRETVQDLGEKEQEGVKGGAMIWTAPIRCSLGHQC